MFKNVLSKVCIVLGVLLISGSTALFILNGAREEEVADTTQKILVEIQNELAAKPLVKDTRIPIEREEEVLVIGDNPYICTLNIPSISLELPVQKEWSYDKLLISPCIYQSAPLSIAAHNYDAHFGRLSELELEDILTMQYFSGACDIYTVVSITQIKETDVEKLDDMDYDLSLFTCSDSNNSERVLVRLQQISGK